MNESYMEQAIKTIEGRVVQLEDALSGERLTGKPGMLQNQVRMITALFDEKEGLVPRLTAMERRELERKGWVKGAYFACLTMGAIIGFVLSHFVLKH